MNSLTKYIIVIGISLLPQIVKSQENSMFLLRGLPQNNEINASAITESKGYIGFPGLNALQVEYYNSGFTLEDILHKGTGNMSDSLVLDFNSFANALSPNNIYFQEFSNSLIGFGFKIKKSYISMSLNTKMKAILYYPGTVGDISKGNYNFENGTYSSLTTQGMSMNGIAYNEIVIGWAYPIKKDLNIGVRMKIIGGVVNVKSEQADLTLTTQSSTELQFKTDAIFQTNIPLTVTLDSLNYVDSIDVADNVDMGQFIKDNMGFGFDVGITYKPSARLTVGIAVNDLGIITYKSNANTFTSNSTFKYSGVDLTGMFGSNAEAKSDYWGNLADSLENSFKFNSNQSKYRTGLQGNIILTGNYSMKSWLDLGAMVKTQFYQGRPYPSLGLACGLSPSKLFSSSISYSMRKGSYFNLGAGFIFKPGPFQLYLVTDNLASAFAIEKAKAINFRFGMNFVFGNGKPKKAAGADIPIKTEG